LKDSVKIINSHTSRIQYETLELVFVIFFVNTKIKNLLLKTVNWNTN